MQAQTRISEMEGNLTRHLRITAFACFLTIERICDGRKEPSRMVLATLLVGVAQLIVAIIAVVIAVLRKQH